MTPAQTKLRARLIRLIHVLRRDLSRQDASILEKDVYQGIIARYANGKTSSADCSITELERILQHFKRCGGKVRKPRAAKPSESRRLDTSAEASKARALWLWLHQIGVVKNPSEAALAAFAKRTCGVDTLQWVQRIDKLIEGIKALGARELPLLLRVRIDHLKAAGRIDPRIGLGSIVHHVAPKRDPECFDALQAAWEFLDEVEQAHERTA